MGWHKGARCPPFVADFYGPRCSQHPFDPYSLTHVLRGFLFFLLLITILGAIYYAVVGGETRSQGDMA